MDKSVYHLENLELIRKKYPNTPAIYFISPSKQSVNKLIEDFSNLKEPQYESIHLFFPTKISGELMELMSQQQGLVERIKTFYELNVDLNLYEDNIYHLDQTTSLSLFNANPNDSYISSFLNHIGLQIFTVCSLLNEKPFIQYQGDSKLAQKVSSALNKQFKDFEQKMPGHEFKDPRSTILILDRSFDLTAPLLHDYAYE